MIMKNFVNNILCKIFGHRMRFNFPSLPSKAICERCHRKWIWMVKLGPDSWKEVDKFPGENRTDEELCEKWFRC